MHRADKVAARYSAVIGGNEVASGRASFKLMADGEQVEGDLVAEEVVGIFR